MKIDSLKSSFLLTLSIIISGLFWYLAFSISGSFGWLLCLAPIPVLISSFYLSGKMTFTVSFLAYLIGRLSWFSYLSSILPLPLVVVYTVFLPVVFALIMTADRKIILKTGKWWAVFVLPALWTAFEILFFKFSPDGTAGSIAYSLSDIMPVIQLASITGISGITFFALFIPSSIALLWLFRNRKKEFLTLFTVSALIALTVLLFGEIRINTRHEKDPVYAGLAVTDEQMHLKTDKPVGPKEIDLAAYYSEKVHDLFKHGARIVVLPEKAINVTPETEPLIREIFIKSARFNNALIIAGITNFKGNYRTNSAFVFSPEGYLLGTYDKVYLIKGLESQFRPGSKAGIFSFSNINVGVAICKDLDFPDYIKTVADKNINVLCVPAWDFVTDDWLHSRMAIMRGIENGISIIRCTRQGRLTISNYLGQVNFEASSSDGKEALLTGEVFTRRANTIYSRFGNWFDILNLFASLFILALMLYRINKD